MMSDDGSCEDLFKDVIHKVLENALGNNKKIRIDQFVPLYDMRIGPYPRWYRFNNKEYVCKNRLEEEPLIQFIDNNKNNVEIKINWGKWEP